MKKPCRFPVPVLTGLLSALVLASPAGAHDGHGDDHHTAAISAALCAADIAASAPDDLAGVERLRTRITGGDRIDGHLERLGWLLAEAGRDGSRSVLLGAASDVARCLGVRGARDAAAMLDTYVLLTRHQFADAELRARELVERRGMAFDHALLGDALLEQGHLSAAASAYQAAVDAKPGPYIHVRAARLAWLQGRVDDAGYLATTAIRGIGRSDATTADWLRSELARYLWRSGRSVDALTVLEQTDSDDALSAGSAALRGEVLMSLGRYDDAVRYLGQAVELDPLPATRWALVEALKATGRWQDGEAERRRLQNDCGDDHARDCALFLATVAARPAEAVTLSTAELDRRGDPLTLDAHAWALNAAGRHSEARDVSRRALAAGIRDPRVDFHAGVIALDNNDFDAAGHWLGRAATARTALLPSEQRLLDSAIAAATASGADVSL